MIKVILPITFLFIFSSPVLAGPVVSEAEKALLKCMNQATGSVCEQADEAVQTIQAVALSSGASAKDFECVSDAMNLRTAIVQLRTGFMSGNSLTAKGEAYKKMAAVKKTCARF